MTTLHCVVLAETTCAEAPPTIAPAAALVPRFVPMTVAAAPGDRRLFKDAAFSTAVIAGEGAGRSRVGGEGAGLAAPGRGSLLQRTGDLHRQC